MALLDDLKYDKIKIWYILSWVGISLISSYTSILYWNFDFYDGDFYKELMSPLLVWILAFFIDYTYTIYNADPINQELDTTYTKASYICIGLIFVVLLLSIWHHSGLEKTVWIITLYSSMIGLKVCSLFVVRPLIKAIQV